MDAGCRYSYTDDGNRFHGLRFAVGPNEFLGCYSHN